MTGAGADLIAQIVPFHARHLAGLAADALGRVDELRDLRRCRPRTSGSGSVVAERRMMSSDCSAI